MTLNKVVLKPSGIQREVNFDNPAPHKIHLDGAIVIAPIVRTDSYTPINYESAAGNGTVLSDGGTTLTARGCCWAVPPIEPTIANSKTTDAPYVVGAFSSYLYQLQPTTTYNFRAYATNNNGLTGYGSVLQFTTPAAPPTLTTTSISNEDYYTAQGGGNITNAGGSAVTITVRGVCWATAPTDPRISNDKTYNGSGTGTYISYLSGLTDGVQYNVRAYATNSAGLTGYGNLVTFSTKGSTVPTVITTDVSDIQYTSASGGGDVTATGGLSVTARGVCWNTGGDPTVPESSKTVDGSGLGIFNSYLSPLAANTTYYYRAYATNSDGPGYGLVKSFTTKAYTAPSGVYISDTSNVGKDNAVLNGGVNDNGGLSITSRGFRLSTTSTFTLGTYEDIEVGAGNIGTFATYKDLLSCYTTYYVKAWASNSIGKTWSPTYDTFDTESYPPAYVEGVVTSRDAEDKDVTAMTLAGYLETWPCPGITKKGFQWGTSTGSYPNSYEWDDTTGIGKFTYRITLLNCNTTYFYRSYAKSTAGIGTITYFSSEKSASTTSPEPTVVTGFLGAVTSNSAIIGVGPSGLNTIPSSCTNITMKGVCYSTSQNPTTSNSTTNDGSGTGSYSSTISGLSPGQTYYVKAYAINSGNPNNTGYGDQISFTTSAIIPQGITMVSATATSSTKIYLVGNLDNNGGSSLEKEGFEITKQGGSPFEETVLIPKIGQFNKEVTVDCYSTYYVRAFAKNSAGYNYSTNGTGGHFTVTTPDDDPTVTTRTQSDLTSTSVTLRGDVTSVGCPQITKKGFEWGTTPSYGTSWETTVGMSTGNYEKTGVVISAGQTYYYRAFVYNTVGGGTYYYGSQETFNAPTAPLGVAMQSFTSSIVDGKIVLSAYATLTSDGGLTLTEKGFYLSTNENFSPSDKYTIYLPAVETWSTTYQNKLCNTRYYIKAYATNSAGESVSSVLSLLTQTIDSTTSIGTTVSYGATSFSPGGTLVNDPCPPVDTKGFCWNTTGNPTINDNPWSISQGGTAAWSTTISAVCNQDYYVKAFVRSTTNAGTLTWYGNEVHIKTLSVLATVSTNDISAITEETATSGGNVSAQCANDPVTAKGVCWCPSAEGTPDINDPHTHDGTGIGSYTSSITGLGEGIDYKVRAYATSSVAGTSYGSTKTFTTQTAFAVVNIQSTSNLTSNSFDVNCYVVSNEDSLTERGVYYSTGSTSPENGTKVVGPANNPYTVSLSSLSYATQYHVKAYATNIRGTAYSTQWDVTTSAVIPPSVTIGSISNISCILAGNGSATCGVNTIPGGDGGSSITNKGVCWGTSSGPTTANSKTDDGTGTGSFTSTITGLVAGQRYYVRAYATNSIGTNYSSIASELQIFITAVAPILTTTTASAITKTTATTGGNISSDGCSAVTARGVCWSQSQNPTISDSKTTDGSGTGSFVSNINGLLPGELYYVRAYATNGVNTSYGAQISFTTSADRPSGVRISSVDEVTSSSARGNGYVGDDNGSSITSKGIQISTNNTFTSTVGACGAGTGIGNIICTVNGLSCNTPLYARAYATNSEGTTYSTDSSARDYVAPGYIQFTTSSDNPTITTTAVTVYGNTTATLGGNLTSTGCPGANAKGVCWSKTTNPIVGNAGVSSQSYVNADAGAFSINVSGLDCNQKYYVKAWARVGDAITYYYGSQVEFTTSAGSPTLDTYTVTTKTSTTALLSGIVSVDSCPALTEKGICWGTSPNPTIAGPHWTPGTTGTGSFSYTATGLICNQTYYVRTYATNSVTTYYDETETWFTTDVVASTVYTLGAVDSTTGGAIIGSGATLSGSAGISGCPSITVRGVCWATTADPTIANSKATAGGGIGEYSVTATGLLPFQTYHYRAYVTTSYTTYYGSDQTFTTGRYYNCGYGCTLYTYNPGCTDCQPGASG